MKCVILSFYSCLSLTNRDKPQVECRPVPTKPSGHLHGVMGQSPPHQTIEQHIQVLTDTMLLAPTAAVKRARKSYHSHK